MKAFNLLFCCTFLLIGCDEDSPIDTRSNSYLPLEVGNTWRFNSNMSDRDHFKRVIAEVNLNNHVYAQVVSGWYNPGEFINDTIYYRVDDRGFVYSRRKNSSNEENNFRLNAQDGDTWTYSAENDFIVAITLSVVNLHIGKKNLGNCKAYFYNAERWADEEHTITLAKGVGFVKEYSNAWGIGHTLKSATINGRQFNFNRSQRKSTFIF